ncbi:MAG TPA: alanine racemase [Tepidisphaeraceae bacterium]|nr:alanine racemase [Tepidisphaeraceae bacterium]
MDARHAPGEPRLLISRAALRHNVRVLRKQLRFGTRVCAIVKADAYGLGAAAVTDALLNFAEDDTRDTRPIVEELAVATIDEAAALPEQSLNILVLRPVENAFVGRERTRLEHAVRNGWALTLCSATAADDIARIAVIAGRRANVHILIDTGMTRGGVAPEQLDALVRKIESLPSLRLIGMFSHFANAEVGNHAQTAHQTALFTAATDSHAGRLGNRIVRHLSNSGGIFFAGSAAGFDMVRPGIALYGIDPTCSPAVDRPLKPVMKWLAPLVDVRDVRAGTSVGYNGTWVASRDSRVGLVPVGYADGYPRGLSGKGITLINGRPAPVIGRVSMDMLTVDLTDLPTPTVGDDVTLLDSDPLSPASIYAVAERAGTIPYEILCRIGPRVRRLAVEPVDEEFPQPRLRSSERSYLA